MVYVPGPFDRKHGYVQWGGSLPGNEQWSCGVRVASLRGAFVPGANLDSAAESWDYEGLLDHYVTAITAMHSAANLALSSTAKLQFVKFNRITRDGHYDESITHQRVFADVGGGGGASGHPNQVALCASLRTALARGPAHEGRIYLPLPSITVGSDGRMASGYTDAATAVLKTWLESMDDTPGIDTVSDPNVVIMSRKLNAPAAHDVSAVSIGRVLDTQRRRRRSLDEAYSTLTLDTGAF